MKSRFPARSSCHFQLKSCDEENASAWRTLRSVRLSETEIYWYNPDELILAEKAIYSNPDGLILETETARHYIITPRWTDPWKRETDRYSHPERIVSAQPRTLLRWVGERLRLLPRSQPVMQSKTKDPAASLSYKAILRTPQPAGRHTEICNNTEEEDGRLVFH